jgi:hypothetical protein
LRAGARRRKRKLAFPVILNEVKDLPAAIFAAVMGLSSRKITRQKNAARDSSLRSE